MNSLISKSTLTAEIAEIAETNAEKKHKNEFFSALLLSDLCLLRG
jgi:hypothetical protein